MVNGTTYTRIKASQSVSRRGTEESEGKTRGIRGTFDESNGSGEGCSPSGQGGQEEKGRSIDLHGFDVVCSQPKRYS